jgi:MraZ protein
MLRGEFEHQLDDRSRIAIPKQLRSALDHGGYLTRGWYGCLFLLPWEDWRKIEDRLSAMPITHVKGDMVRVFFSGGAECWADKQGRVIVPAALRQYAGIERDVVVRGVMNRIEVWGKERWEAFQAEQFVPERIMELAAELEI